MADITIKSQLEGNYKEVYGEKLVDPIPQRALLTREIPFRETDMLGNAFHMPLIVSDEQGVTYAGPEEDGFDLEDAEAMATKDATVKGSQIVVRAMIGYKAAAAAVAGGKKAFVNATDLVIRRMLNTAGRRVEIMLLYGGSGLGKITASANVSATETEIDFTAATWAPGLWVGLQNAKLEVFNGASLVATVKVGHITDLRLGKMTVTGTAGEITALDAEFPATLDIFFKGAKGKEALGLDQICTTSGLLFGIDNTVYDLHKAQSFDVGGVALSFSKLTDAIVNAVNYGLEEDVQVHVSARTWQNLNKDEAALRNYDASYKPGSMKGSSSISYQIMDISIEVRCNTFVKEGEAFVFPKGVLRRVGAYDLSLKNPGRGDDMFRELDSKSGFELRAYTDQALFCERVALLIKLSNIVNS